MVGHGVFSDDVNKVSARLILAHLGSDLGLAQLIPDAVPGTHAGNANQEDGGRKKTRRDVPGQVAKYT